MGPKIHLEKDGSKSNDKEIPFGDICFNHRETESQLRSVTSSHMICDVSTLHIGYISYLVFLDVQKQTTLKRSQTICEKVTELA